MVHLSDISIRRINPPKSGQKDYYDEVLHGFGIRISHGGTRTFFLYLGGKYKRHRVTIGRFPIISLAKARTEARRLLAEQTLGKVRPHSITYPSAVELFLEDKARAKKFRTVADYKRLLNRVPFRGQIADVTHADFHRILNRFTSPSEREHLRVATKVFFNWCRKRRYVDHNPTEGLAATKFPARARILSDNELKAIWTASSQCGQFGIIVRLLILTGMRRGECAAIQHSWVQADTLVLPASVTKNSREHRFPLPKSAQNLLTPLRHGGLLFPARGSTSKPFNGWGKAKAQLDEKSGIEGWRLHDLRRTFASGLARLGVQLPVIERLLNHVSGSFGGIVGVYQRHDFMPEMRAAIDLWEAHLQRVLELA